MLAFHSPKTYKVLEICYIMRSFEKHGRGNLKDPWSLRQMAVYQRYDMSKMISVWIVLQPFQRYRRSLWKEFRNSGPSANPLTLHALLISLEASNWRWYLNDIRRTLSAFVSGSFFGSFLDSTDGRESSYQIRLKRPDTRLPSQKRLIMIPASQIASGFKPCATSFQWRRRLSRRIWR